MSQGIFAVRDTLANTIVGGLYLFAHPAAAVRFFGDIASDAQTSVARHISDHELINLGTLDTVSGVVTPSANGPEIIITGAAWKAAQVNTSEAVNNA